MSIPRAVFNAYVKASSKTVTQFLQAKYAYLSFKLQAVLKDMGPAVMLPLTCMLFYHCKNNCYRFCSHFCSHTEKSVDKKGSLENESGSNSGTQRTKPSSSPER